MVDALVDARQKLTDFEAQEKVVAHKVVEAYKLSKDCKDQNIAFSKLAFLKGMEKTRRRVAEHFPDLDLSFLDKEEQIEGEPASTTKEAIGPSATA